MNRQRALFLDRDGVLNVDREYLFRPEELEWVPGAHEAVRRANEAGYLVIVVTNQSGVARGMYSEADVQNLHAWMQQELGRHGAHIDAFYYCPHHPQASVPEYGIECSCRKPESGMFDEAIAKFHIDPAASFVIGDKDRDIEAGRRAGVRGFLFSGGNLDEFLRRIIPRVRPEHVTRLGSASIVCVGDVMLDHFVYGEVDRISPEAPIPVLRAQSRKSMLGGAGNAVRNLCALGAEVRFLTVLGRDEAGTEIEKLCRDLPRCECVLVDERARRTSTKTRFVAHGQQLLRVDHEDTAGISDYTLDQLLEGFRTETAGAHAVLLSDYGKGVLTGARVRRFIEAAAAADLPVVVDPKGVDFSRYASATLLKPNLRELALATGLPVESDDEVERAARRVLSDASIGYVLVTRGSSGMTLIPASGDAMNFPALAREVYDVSGAGDTVAAVLAAAMGSGLPVTEAVEMANVAAGIVVAKTGTATVDRDEILRAL